MIKALSIALVVIALSGCSVFKPKPVELTPEPAVESVVQKTVSETGEVIDRLDRAGCDITSFKQISGRRTNSLEIMCLTGN